MDETSGGGLAEAAEKVGEVAAAGGEGAADGEGKAKGTRGGARTRRKLVDHVSPIETLQPLIAAASAEDKVALLRRAKAVVAAIRDSEQLDPARDALRAELQG